MIVATTKSAEDTREVGANVGEVAQAGDVILLAGDLGAGKTTFTQGFARALEVAEWITSPTFVLVRSYEGARLRLHHADLYRLEEGGEVDELALPELIDDDAVLLVEWGERAAPAVGPDFLEVHIEFGDDDDERRLHLRPVGPSWSARLPKLTTRLGNWL